MNYEYQKSGDANILICDGSLCLSGLTLCIMFVTQESLQFYNTVCDTSVYMHAPLRNLLPEFRAKMDARDGERPNFRLWLSAWTDSLSVDALSVRLYFSASWTRNRFPIVKVSTQSLRECVRPSMHPEPKSFPDRRSIDALSVHAYFICEPWHEHAGTMIFHYFLLAYESCFWHFISNFPDFLYLAGPKLKRILLKLFALRQFQISESHHLFSALCIHWESSTLASNIFASLQTLHAMQTVVDVNIGHLSLMFVRMVLSLSCLYVMHTSLCDACMNSVFPSRKFEWMACISLWFWHELCASLSCIYSVPFS